MVTLHAGLPRTATTVLQREVFPALQAVAYIGKDYSNIAIRGPFNPEVLARDCAQRMARGDQRAAADLQSMFPTLLHRIKLQIRDKGDAPVLIGRWWKCVRIVQELVRKPLLYSDESLVESMSGLDGSLEYGDGIPLERFAAHGHLAGVHLSVVFREPIEFLAASYYKAMEFYFKYRKAAYSFDEYIRRQCVLLDRHPSASRIFLAQHRRASEQLRSLCPRLVTVGYRQLVDANNSVDLLLGRQTGEAGVPFHRLRRENSSWRSPEVNEFILGAPGVPAGISIGEYREQFEGALERAGVLHTLRAEQLFE